MIDGRRIMQANSMKKNMQNAENLKKEIIRKLRLQGITKGQCGSFYRLRYRWQTAEEAHCQIFHWEELLVELVIQSVMFGVENVIGSAYIEHH